MKKTEYICTAADTYQRLDYILKKIFPEYGTRTLKRFCEHGLVQVNNKNANASYKVKENDQLVVLKQNILVNTQPVFIIKENHNYLAIYKKPFLHSEHHAGKQENSAEFTVHQKISDSYILLNRLDYATSGILVFAKNQDAANQWKILQHANQIEKKYLAITEGSILHSLLIKNTILSAKRKTVQVSSENGDRITKVTPFAINSNDNCSLADCSIYQGARHQIRSHLAYLGFPLAGDSKYGATFKVFDEQNNSSLLQHMKPYEKFSDQNKKYFLDQQQLEFIKTFAMSTKEYLAAEEHFCLHHYELISPNFYAFVLPPFWNELPDSIQHLLLSKQK